MKATKIKMKKGCTYSNSTREIDSIYLDATNNYWKKEVVHDYLVTHPKSIQVNIFPYPFLEPVESKYGEKYVRSAANDSSKDNLLQLPRE